jgi:hypothetical protein
MTHIAMHSKRAISYAVHGFGVWTLFFVMGALLIGTDAFRLLPKADPRRIIGFIIFLCSLTAMALQTYSTLSLFRAFTARDRERRWNALPVCVLGWFINFGLGSQGAAVSLFCLISELPTGEDD